MTGDTIPEERQPTVEPLDEVFDHVRGPAAGRLILEYRFSPQILRRIRRDVESGIASGEVRGTPTLFIDGVVHLGGYDAATLMEALAG
jgi:hypothetical protein